MTASEPRQRNRSERLALALERDGGRCVWCARPVDVGLVRATTEHVVPRARGGPSWSENEVPACARCNRERGHEAPAAWLEECERRGWQPNRPAVVGSLLALQQSIAERGGQRRARRYVDHQLRRLGRHSSDPAAAAP